jgi:hypothetical protein
MNKLLLLFFLIFWNKGNSQNQITEIKNQGGATIQYVLETDKILCSKIVGQFKLSFIWSINELKQYLQITIPEEHYRRVYTHDSVKLIFDDGSVVALNVVKDQNGYMLRDRLLWVDLDYAIYLPFMVDMSDSLLNNLSSKTLKDVYFICLGNPQDISDDYRKLYYPFSNYDKRKFQKRASIDRIFTRRAVNKKGKEHIKLSAEKFTVFISNL